MIQTSVSQFHFQQPKVAQVDLLACGESHLGCTDERLNTSSLQNDVFRKALQPSDNKDLLSN